MKLLRGKKAELAFDEIYKFIKSELYAKNGWYFGWSNCVGNKDGYDFIRCRYHFNTMLSIPFTPANLSKINKEKKRIWDELELDVYTINPNPDPGVLASWYRDPIEIDYDYSRIAGDDRLTQAFLVFGFKN